MKMMTRRSFLSLSAATAAALGISFLPVETAEACFAIPDAQNLLEEAYLYAFPLVIMNATKIYSTNTETANNIRAPINQFNHARKLADASFRTVVTPNVDTIYTQAWLDLSEEPMIYVVPATDRFFNVQVWMRGRIQQPFWKNRASMRSSAPAGRERFQKVSGRSKFLQRPSGRSPVSFSLEQKTCRMSMRSRSRCS